VEQRRPRGRLPAWHRLHPFFALHREMSRKFGGMRTLLVRLVMSIWASEPLLAPGSLDCRGARIEPRYIHAVISRCNAKNGWMAVPRCAGLAASVVPRE